MRTVTISAVGLLLSMPAAGHGEAIAIVGGTLIDGTGTGPVEDSAVVIEHGRVVYAGTRADASIPEESKAIDASGKFLVPGLADMHNHLADGTFELGRPSSNAAKNLRCLLARGITTVFNPGVDVNTFVELKRLARENPRSIRTSLARGRPSRGRAGMAPGWAILRSGRSRPGRGCEI